MTTHGCGEYFPLDPSLEKLDEAPSDGERDLTDRRVEVFCFDGKLGVQPPATGEISKRGSAEYPEWRARARLAVAASAQEGEEQVCHLTFQICHRSSGLPLANQDYILDVGLGQQVTGMTDPSGRLHHAFVAPDDYRLQIAGTQMFVPALSPDEPERVLAYYHEDP